MRVTSHDSTQGRLKQRFSVLSTMAMAFAILNTWIALAGSIGLVLPSGGSTALLYGFVLCVLCNFALAMSLAELAAIWPTAGGQYHFVYAVCTQKWKRPMSFLAGWANIFGWLSVITVQSFFAALFICAAAVIASDDGFVVTEAKTYGIFMAVLIFGTIVNIWGNKILSLWNSGALYWSVLGVVVISVVLLAMSEKTTAEFVFTEYNNETGWPDGMAWLLGLLQPALSLIGYDVVMHMAEEMPNPSRDVPRAMIYAVTIGGVTGTFFILVALFCFTNPEVLLASSTGIPISEMLLVATKSRAAATVLNLILAVCFVNGTVASITSASRLLFAMARDGGMFWSRRFAKISPSLDVPVLSIVACSCFNALFGLIYLGPYVAFGAYMSSCTIFLNFSYAMPVALVLIRGRSVLAEHQRPGLPNQLGRWGLLCNIVATIYVILTTVVSPASHIGSINPYLIDLFSHLPFSFPSAVPVTGENMNYVVVVCGIFLVFISTYWLVYGKFFTGPDFESIFGNPGGVIRAENSQATNSPPSGYEEKPVAVMIA